MTDLIPHVLSDPNTTSETRLAYLWSAVTAARSSCSCCWMSILECYHGKGGWFEDLSEDGFGPRHAELFHSEGLN